jgi:predicted phosphodiesterase
MKIQILSDQHIEFKKNYGYVINRMIPRADVLVIAGDFCNHTPMREKFIQEHLLPKWKHIIMIPGNHDLWDDSWDHPSFGFHRQVFEKNGNKCYYVNNQIIEIDDVSFICSTMWTHIGAVNSFSIHNSMGDYDMIDGLTVEKINEYHLLNRGFLNESMYKLTNVKTKRVIVTHHVPSFNLISPAWRNHTLNEAFAADMDTFIMMHGDDVSLWIHGHSHDCVDKYLGDIRFVRNPMGYPHERKGDMDLVISV